MGMRRVVPAAALLALLSAACLHASDDVSIAISLTGPGTVTRLETGEMCVNGCVLYARPGDTVTLRADPGADAAPYWSAPCGNKATTCVVHAVGPQQARLRFLRFGDVVWLTQLPIYSGGLPRLDDQNLLVVGGVYGNPSTTFPYGVQAGLLDRHGRYTPIARLGSLSGWGCQWGVHPDVATNGDILLSGCYRDKLQLGSDVLGDYGDEGSMSPDSKRPASFSGIASSRPIKPSISKKHGSTRCRTTQCWSVGLSTAVRWTSAKPS